MATPTNNYAPVTNIRVPADNSIASLLSGTKWGGALGTGFSLIYSFPTTSSFFASPYGDQSDDVNEPDGLQALNPAQRDRVTYAITRWEFFANIHLGYQGGEETSDFVGEVRIAFSTAVDASEASAWAYYPSNQPSAGDIWLAPELGSESFEPGSWNFHVLLHEVGHAIGLKHPHEDSPLLPSALDSIVYTVMSYNPDVALDRYPTTPMVLDIAAAQYLYGKANLQSGNDSYRFYDGDQYFMTVWDAGGIDKFVYEGTTGARIDLRPGSGSTFGMPILQWVGSWEVFETRTVWIAKGAIIEHATGGYGNDIMTGNDVANTLMGNLGDDSLSGMNGNDRLLGGSGNDLLTGGAGQDYLDGGPGSDRYRATAEAKPDTYKDTGSGAADVDTILTAGVPTVFLPATFSEVSSGIDAITNSTGLTILSGTGEARVNWDFRTITLRGIRQLGGTESGDRIVGSLQNDVIAGKGGNDSLFGYSGHDWINGGAGNDLVSGGAGNDTLQGSSGNDLIQGGPGNDVIYFDAGDARGVQGESGRDTLKLSGGGLVLDLSAILDTQFTGFEIFDITGTGNNQLKLDIDDVLALPDGLDAFFSDGTTQLLIMGNAGDSVSLLDLGWVEGTDLMVNGIECTPYTFNTAQLLIDTDLNVIVG